MTTKELARIVEHALTTSTLAKDKESHMKACTANNTAANAFDELSYHALSHSYREQAREHFRTAEEWDQNPTRRQKT